MTTPGTLGDLKRSPWADAPLRGRTVRDEIRTNLLRALENGEPLFPGIVGYEDTVLPQLVNALLARHHFILLGLRGQAKSRILRELVTLPRRGDPDRRRQRGQRRPVRADLQVRAGNCWPSAATPRRSRGCRASSATSRSWRRPT